MATTSIPDTLYVQVPDVTPRRVLHPCQVVDGDSAEIVIEATEPLQLVVDGTALVYYDERQQFVQQAARVVSIEPMSDHEDDGLRITLERLGEPVNAEQRQVYRVSCINVPITASLGQESGCAVVDISATGFGAYSAKPHKVGTTLPAKLHWDDTVQSGTVVIVSARSMDDGRYRYGMRCVDTQEAGLKRSLVRISLSVQREQMRRV